MVTLIAVYNSEGCVGRCDARCYSARYAACSCVCGAANHQQGLAIAAANTQAMAETWIQKAGGLQANVNPQLALL
jgi:hypothetical protein